MNQISDIRKKKNKLYTDLLIAIKEEEIKNDNDNDNNQNKNITKSKEISLKEAIDDIFNNLRRVK